MMPAGTTALVVLPAPSTPAGPTWDEQASDVSPGNSFPNDGTTLLYCRNTTASPISVTFEADLYGAEVAILSVAIPGSGTEHGVRVLGPFPPGRFNGHESTDNAKTGHVFVRQASGSDGQLQLCPFQINRSLLSGTF
jgi:hypothetical protein